MITIYKYPVPITDQFVLSMPKEASPLTVQVQNGTPMLWAMVNTNTPTVERVFRVYGTGHPIPVPLYGAVDYIGTFQTSGGRLVWHLFRDTPEDQ